MSKTSQAAMPALGSQSGQATVVEASGNVGQEQAPHNGRCRTTERDHLV